MMGGLASEGKFAGLLSCPGVGGLVLHYPSEGVFKQVELMGGGGVGTWREKQGGNRSDR